MNKMPHIDIIFFDLGNVLVHVYPERAVDKIALELGLPPLAVQDLWQEKGPLFTKLERGLIQPGQFVSELFDGKWRDKKETALAAFASIFELNHSVVAVAKRLAKNYRLSIISNTNEIHFNKIVTDYPEMIKLFESPITSNKVGSIKPEPEIYLAALEQLKCRPQESLFIDDKKENILAARDIGMVGIHYSTCNQLKDELEKLNISL